MLKKGSKRIGRWVVLALTLIMCLGLTLPALADTSTEFTDIDSHWAGESIIKWIDRGFIKGYENGTFRPNNHITRAEFVTLTNKAFNFTKKADVEFTDVSETAWFYDEIAKAVKAGYLSGYEDGTVKPNQAISRQEAAAALCKALKLSAKTGDEINQFTDVASIPEWSKPYIEAVVGQEFMGGYPDGSFKANNPISRAETVVVLDRALENAAVSYDQAGVYGPETNMAIISKDVMINAAGVTLRNTTIEGNLYLNEGIGEGDIDLENVIVKKSTIIRGGGKDSIYLTNFIGKEIIVKKIGGKIRIVATGSTNVAELLLQSGAHIEGNGFEIIRVLKPREELVLDGDFEKVIVEVDTKVEVLAGTTISNLQIDNKSHINLARGVTVRGLTLNAPATISGKGTIETAKINVSGAALEMQPKKVELAKGITARVAGKEVKEEITVRTGGSSGGGGGYYGPAVDQVADIIVTTSPINTSALEHDAGLVMVRLETTTADAEIRYTINGSTPTASATLYAEPFTVSNPGGIAGGTVTIKAIGIKADMSNSAVTQRVIVYKAASAATVNTAAEFKTALATNSVSTITLGGDITGNAIATRTGSNNFTINFGTYTLAGELDITANNATNITFSGSAVPAITGDLTVTAANATVTNGINVGGVINVIDVGGSSWHEQVDGNRIILTDDNGATIVINGNPEDITIGEGAGGGINITANSPVTITVNSGATVNNITAEAAGTIITNNGTVSNVTANADVEIIANAGSSSINVAGSGTVSASGDANVLAQYSGNPVVAGISASLGLSQTLRMGATETANITIATSGNSYNVTSANPSIVSVDAATGLAITAKKPGRTAITVQVKDSNGDVTHQGTIFVTVLPELISAGSAVITAPALGKTPQTAAQVETATANRDYTVTGLTWNQALTPDGKFKAGETYTATVVLTSKNNKAFQQSAFTPTVANAASVGTTLTVGTDAGNRVSFTVTFPATEALKVTGIEVTTQPTKMTYAEGTDNKLALNGMVVTATNNDGTTKEVTFTGGTAAGYTASPANGTNLTNAAHDGKPVTITHTASGQTASTGNLAVLSGLSITGVSEVKVKDVIATVDGLDTKVYNVALAAGTILADLTATDIVVTATDSKASVATATTADGGKTWTVVVTAEDATTKATYTINVTVANAEQKAPTGLAGVAPTSAANNSGQITGTTTAMEYRRSGATTWTPATATRITGLAAGTYEVRLAAKEGFNAGAVVEVVVPAYEAPPSVTVSVNAISVNKEITTLTVGATETLIATVSPSNATDKTVTWTSDKTDVATVDNGEVTAVAAGTATITATSAADGTKTATTAITVKVATAATPIDNGASNPSTVVSLTGDTFAASAVNTDNWTIDAGTTGLTVDTITLQDVAGTATGVTIDFTGTAAAGTLNITPKAEALTSGVEGNAVTITVDPTQDNTDIGTAKGNIEGATYTATQAEAGDAPAAATKAQALVDALELAGTTAVVVPGTFNAATAGTVETPAGTNGSYTFTVTIDKGTGTQVTSAEQTMTITATAYDATQDNIDIGTGKTILETAGALNPVEGTDSSVRIMAQALLTNGVVVTISDASGNSKVGADGTITYDGDAVTGNVVFALNKGLGTEQTAIMSVIVPAGNFAPTGNDQTAQAIENMKYSLDLTTVFSDDRDTSTALTYTVVGDDGSAVAALAADGKILEYTPAANDVDHDVVITVRATDTEGAVSENVTITLNVVSEFAGGTGTAGDPWQISTPLHLNNIRNYVGSASINKYFVLLNDIDMTDFLGVGGPECNDGAGWRPIGGTSSSNGFRGTLLGNNKTISNLTINRYGQSYTGLFSYAYEHTIQNLALTNVSIIGGGTTGSIAGAAAYGNIENVTVTGSVSGSGGYVGGVIGDNGTGSSLYNVYAHVNVAHGSYAVGGFIGRNSGTIQNCYTVGSVSGTSQIGGFAGSSPGTISDSYYDSTVSGYSDTGKGEPRTTAQMLQQSNYTGWDFDSVWDINAVENSGYPFLRWQGYTHIGNDASLSVLTIGGQDVMVLPALEVANQADAGAELVVADFTGFAGIAAVSSDAGATVVVTLNGGVVNPEDLDAQSIVQDDVIVVAVTAQDGVSARYYKVTVVALVDAEAPSIANDLTDQTTPQNTAVTLDATAIVTDGGVLSYVWYSADDADKTNPAVISGETSATYAPPVDIVGTFYYYAVVTNTNESATGNKTAETTSAVARIEVVEAAPASAAVLTTYEENATVAYQEFRARSHSIGTEEGYENLSATYDSGIYKVTGTIGTSFLDGNYQHYNDAVGYPARADTFDDGRKAAAFTSHWQAPAGATQYKMKRGETVGSMMVLGHDPNIETNEPSDTVENRWWTWKDSEGNQFYRMSAYFAIKGAGDDGQWALNPAGSYDYEIYFYDGAENLVEVQKATIDFSEIEIEEKEVAVNPLTKSYYAADETLAFTINNLRPYEEVVVGMPINTGAGGNPWASDEKVISGMTEIVNGDVVRYFEGTTNANGELTVSGEVQADLPSGVLHITLPDYDIGIDSAIELQDDQGAGVRVGPITGGDVTITTGSAIFTYTFKHGNLTVDYDLATSTYGLDASTSTVQLEKEVEGENLTTEVIPLASAGIDLVSGSANYAGLSDVGKVFGVDFLTWGGPPTLVHLKLSDGNGWTESITVNLQQSDMDAFETLSLDAEITGGVARDNEDVNIKVSVIEDNILPEVVKTSFTSVKAVASTEPYTSENLISAFSAASGSTGVAKNVNSGAATEVTINSVQKETHHVLVMLLDDNHYVTGYQVFDRVATALKVTGTASDPNVTMEGPGNTAVDIADNTWTIAVTQGTVKAEVNESDLTITGLPDGLSATAEKGEGNIITIAVAGTANPPITDTVVVNVIVKGSAVEEVGATDSDAIDVFVIL